MDAESPIGSKDLKNIPQQDSHFPDEPELRNIFENSPDIYDDPIDTVFTMARNKRERSATPDGHRKQSASSRKRMKTDHKAEGQDAVGVQDSHDPPVGSVENDKLAFERTMFESRRKTVVRCHDAVRAMVKATNALVKSIIAQVHEVTKHESIPLFAMLPKPNNEAFTIMAVSFPPGFGLEKARWHYEILYSIGAPLESALDCLTQTHFHLKEEMDKATALRTNGGQTLKSLAAQEMRDAHVFKDLLRRIDKAVKILDKLSERIGKHRFEVDEHLMRRFNAANKQVKTQMVNQVWMAAKKGWGTPGFGDTKEGKELRMLRILRKYEVIEPILRAWNKMLKARNELKECCSR